MPELIEEGRREVAQRLQAQLAEAETMLWQMRDRIEAALTAIKESLEYPARGLRLPETVVGAFPWPSEEEVREAADNYRGAWKDAIAHAKNNHQHNPSPSAVKE